MVTEIAHLEVKPGSSADFEAAFGKAQQLISAMPGYLGHSLKLCIEKPGHYLLTVYWETLQHHTVGFRQSAEYQQWKALLHHFYDPFPQVEHYLDIFAGSK